MYMISCRSLQKKKRKKKRIFKTLDASFALGDTTDLYKRWTRVNFALNEMKLYRSSRLVCTVPRFC